jgi:hypothetical protein
MKSIADIIDTWVCADKKILKDHEYCIYLFKIVQTRRYRYSPGARLRLESHL